MAEKENSWEDNATGKWYVDKNCSLCGVCMDVAPEFFQESEIGDYAIISQQPVSEEDIEACIDAKDQCPVESIGDDG
jgi:ferredoxin